MLGCSADGPSGEDFCRPADVIEAGWKEERGAVGASAAGSFPGRDRNLISGRLVIAGF